MALTAEQKAANKVKSLARDRAYRERRNAYRAAVDAALAPLPLRPADQDPKVAPAAVVQAAWAADAAYDAASAAANEEEAAIRAQIAQLEQSLKGVRARHKTTELADVRRDAYSALSAARKAAEEAVNAQYPDVAGVFSAAQWGAIVGFGADTQK
ncbi:hypothetical protein KTD31_01510 [Burkholderia multivorans]|uniref:hypothetical protein n=1 Tax=Burkholderia multivorans TaxID=87883 RepID=UPI001C210ADC|nr:hypothetical protein [Burkholderia multivorans]MBU9200079.1 hypothetical protein [Burkholderia multivorans]